MTNNKPEEENITSKPLEELLEDESQASERGVIALRDLVKPYAFIGKHTKRIVLRDEAHELSAKLRMILLFLCGLVKHNLGLGDGSFSQKEIIEFFTPHGVPEGTIKATLKALRDERLISEAQKSRYFVGFDKLSKIKAVFNKNEK